MRSRITARLLDWYWKNKRTLPWRDIKNPYFIWVSEIMLQQTQVNTVIPYFNRFIEKYPDIESLARADRDELMKLWEGLGYYQRVRNMQIAAKVLMERHGGKMPETKSELIKLKGIGEYVSAAIAGFAFNENCAAVDGNVIRVISRLNLLTEDTSKIATKRKIAEYSTKLLPKGQACDFNQALMELGALVCRKHNPECVKCPIQSECKASKKGKTHEIPYKPSKKPVPHYLISVGAILKEDRVLIGLRKPEGLLGNLWELPGGKRKNDESQETCCIREIKEETGLTVRIIKKIGIVKHAYTHFKITMHAFLCEEIDGIPVPNSAVELKYVKINSLSGYAFPIANHPILETLRKMVKQ